MSNEGKVGVVESYKTLISFLTFGGGWKGAETWGFWGVVV
jgi:hypothetical protein